MVRVSKLDLPSEVKRNENTGADELAGRTKRTVLICDDETEECIKMYLNVKHSGRRKIDLILLDYKLAVTTGYHVAQKIKELELR